MREFLIQRDVSVTKQEEVNLQRVIFSRNPYFSIEICPGRAIDEHRLLDLSPRFCSITWLPPCSSQSKKITGCPAAQLLAGRLQRYGHSVLLHLAGRNMRKHEVLSTLERAEKAGVKMIFALQGDPTRITEWDDNECDFPFAADLVKFIKSYFPVSFRVGVAGYPEKHPHSPDLLTDVEHLKYKVSCGADFIITQASYSYAAYEDFARICRDVGIRIPIIPGMFIIKSYRSLLTISNFCSVPIPADVLQLVDRNKENNESVKNFGVHHVTTMAKEMLKRRDLYQNVHLFSLNDLSVVKDILRNLGLFDTYIERPFAYSKTPGGPVAKCVPDLPTKIEVPDTLNLSNWFFITDENRKNNK